MKIEELCRKIELQEPVTAEVLEFSNKNDFFKIEELLNGLKVPDKWDAARGKLEQLLAPDENQFKMLACMLYCAAGDYEEYQRLKIGDDIYIATMKCFPRFLEECREKSGAFAFDRSFWTVRQIGMKLFRIGTLEYERTELEGDTAISIHIPSDADLSPEACEASLRQVVAFMNEKFPQEKSMQYFCSSWLLSPSLKELLPAGSKIVQFQERFEIIDQNPDSNAYLEWVYQKNNCPIEQLPEDTSLQKRMKAYLLSGGKIGEALGMISMKQQ